jgi:cytochrome c biogenesis protein CcmG/thiol:disulfide interchange protein DsbE
LLSTPSSADRPRLSRTVVVALIALSLAIPAGVLAVIVTNRTTTSPSCGARPTNAVPPVARGRVAVDEPLPNITLMGTDCTLHSFAALRGSAAVIVFFGSWCHQCEEELPVLERVQREEPRRLAVVGVNFRDFPRDSDDFARQLHVTFPVLLEDAVDNPVAALFGVTGIPATFFVDARGVLRFRVFGKSSRTDLQPYVTAILAR